MKIFLCLLVMAVTLGGGGGGADDDRPAPAPPVPPVPPAPSSRVVVVFTALDRVYSDPILRRFTEATGIEVRPVFDTEAAKTTGLISRLIARRDDPECDVLWNNEPVQTAQLAELGLLAEYRSPQAERIPPQFRDPQGRWTGFAARLRVIIYNTDMLSGSDVPTGLGDFADPRRRGQAALALPFFGTTLTHMTVLSQRWEAQRFEQWLAAVRANDVALAAGNGPVRDLVAAGERAFGLTDTDDAHGAMLDGKPVAVVVPDAAGGALLLPNTVALIAGCRRPAEGKALVDYLLSPQVERDLAAARSAQIPLGTDLAQVRTPWDEFRKLPKMEYDLSAAAASKPRVIDMLKAAGMDR